MEKQGSSPPAAEESPKKIPLEEDDGQDAILGVCSLKGSMGGLESEGSQVSFEDSPTAQREGKKFWSVGGSGRKNKKSGERDSSVDSSSSRVAPYNSEWGSADFTHASASFQGLPETPIVVAKKESAQKKDRRPDSSETSTILTDASHRAYWAELQNRLPMPLVELMEREVLEILRKSLNTYRRGIGKEHQLTKQLQKQVEMLRQNLQSRQLAVGFHTNPAPPSSSSAPNK